MAHVTVIGYGVQGSAVAERLAGAGHAVTVFDADVSRTRDVAPGIQVAADVPAAVAAGEFVLTVVTAGPAVRSALLDPRALAALGPGTCVVQMGSASPEDTTACRTAVEATGATFTCDVVHAVRDAILAGQALLLFGGTPEQHVRVSDLLSPVGKSVAVGTPEQAAVFNAAGLVMLYAVMHAFAVGQAMVERAGMPVDAWATHVQHSGVLMGFMSGFMGPAHFTPRNYAAFGPCQFANDGAYPETQIMDDLAAALGIDRGLTGSFLQAHRQAFAVAPRADFSSVYDVIAPRTA